MKALVEAARGTVLKPSIRHRVAVGLTVTAMAVVTGCAQPPTEPLGATQEAVESANVAGATDNSKQDVASDKDLMAKTPTGIERADLETNTTDLESLEIRLGAVHQVSEKGDHLRGGAQAEALKEKDLALAGATHNAIEQTIAENPISHGYSRLGHPDDRHISNRTLCEAGPIPPMRKHVIRAMDPAPLVGRVYADCQDELL